MLHKVNQTAYAIALRSLLDGPVTVQDIMHETGLSVATTRSLMRTLKQYRVVHIGSWEQNSQSKWIVPVYVIGAGRDAKRPKMSRAEVNERYKRKKEQLALSRLEVYKRESLDTDSRAVQQANHPAKQAA